MDNVPMYFRYWGKAKPSSDGGPQYHLLPYHCLDVAAVAAAWWENSSALRQAFVRSTGIEEKLLKAWVLFFVALHDLGKLDVRFQNKSLDALGALWEHFNEEDADSDGKYYHGPMGFYMFRQEIRKALDCDFDRVSPWLRAVCGHHGDVTFRNEWSDANAEDWIVEQDKSARLQWVKALEERFLAPLGLSLSECPAVSPPCLAGFCSVCDWLGSDSEVFKYKESGSNLDEYWEYVYPLASDSLKSFGVLSITTGNSGFSTIYPEHVPRQLQTTIPSLPIEAGLTIVEAPTGSGKTETAIAYGSHLLSKGLADSIIFALPTQATANAMLERIHEVAGKLFVGGSNLVLAHGRAKFNENFHQLKAEAEKPNVQLGESASVQCVKWLGESRKRVFLGQIGVCTIDQVLVSVLPVRHNFVRSFGIQKSLLIIDEVHAYDAYMYGLLSAVLSVQREAGGSAILLSATLPSYQKQQLLEAWGAPKEINFPSAQNPYPLVTQYLENKLLPTQIEDASHLPKQFVVDVELSYSCTVRPDDDLIERIIEAANQGALVAAICNLVDDAQQIYMAVADAVTVGEFPVEVDLFHARYCFSDRQAKEKRVMENYGKGARRDGGRILVATQVVEQSLDLDFDWMVTQICPCDLLFQRLGRLHRHERENRPEGFCTPKVTVIVPEEDDYQLHSKVYRTPRYLWRTQQLLKEGKIAFPSAYREWIEKVYDQNDWDNEPEHIIANHDEYKALSDYVNRFAKNLAATEYSNFADTENTVALMTRDGDMNLSLVLLQRTSQGDALLDGRLLDGLSEWERQEAITLNTVGVPSGWKRWLPESHSNEIELYMSRVRYGEVTTWLWNGGKYELCYDSMNGLWKQE